MSLWTGERMLRIICHFPFRELEPTDLFETFNPHLFLSILLFRKFSHLSRIIGLAILSDCMKERLDAGLQNFTKALINLLLPMKVIRANNVKALILQLSGHI